MLMSKEVFVTCLIILAIAALILVPGAFDAAFALVFLGMIPFTSYSIPPLAMLIIYALLITLGIRWLFVQPVLIPDTKRREALSRSKARRRVIKKTKTTAASIKKRRRYQETAKA